MEIRTAVAAYVNDRILATRQTQAQLPSESTDKVDGGYQNVSVIRANSMKHMPNFFAKGQVRGVPPGIRQDQNQVADSRAVDEDVLPLSRPALQSP